MGSPTQYRNAPPIEKPALDGDQSPSPVPAFGAAAVSVVFMSTNTPPNSFGPGPYGAAPQGAPGQPGPGQYAQQPNPFGPRPLISPKDAVTNLVMCDIPIVIGFIALFLPYFTVEVAMYSSESISWANGGSEGPFIFALIFLIVALIPLVLQFVPRINPKQLLSSSGLVTAAGIVLAINIARNFSPTGVDGYLGDMEAYGITISRGIGFWLLCAASIGLIGTGILFSTRVKKAIDSANQAPNAFGAPYPGPGFPAPGAQGFPANSAQRPFPAPGQQPPAQPWGNQPNQYGQPGPGQQPFNQQPNPFGQQNPDQQPFSS